MTCRGLDCPVIKSRWGEIFHTHPDQAWGPNNLLYNGYPRVGGQGMVLTMLWPSNAKVRERLELYLYSHLCALMAFSRVKYTFNTLGLDYN